MTKDDLEEFFENSPNLYHMAQPGSWSLIEKLGLLTTNQLLEKFEIPDDQKRLLTSQRRPESVQIVHENLGQAVVRDQIPLLDADLESCLLDGLTPLDWHKLLNERVFFWTSEERLHRLTGAGAYRDMEHDVLTLDSRSLFSEFYSKIELSPMNSGCTRPWRHKRGKDTFLPIDAYDYKAWRKKRKKHDVVAEVTVIEGVSPILPYVTEVRRMKRDETLQILFS